MGLRKIQVPTLKWAQENLVWHQIQTSSNPTQLKLALEPIQFLLGACQVKRRQFRRFNFYRKTIKNFPWLNSIPCTANHNHERHGTNHFAILMLKKHEWTEWFHFSWTDMNSSFNIEFNILDIIINLHCQARLAQLVEHSTLSLHSGFPSAIELSWVRAPRWAITFCRPSQVNLALSPLGGPAYFFLQRSS